MMHSTEEDTSVDTHCMYVPDTLQINEEKSIPQEFIKIAVIVKNYIDTSIAHVFSSLLLDPAKATTDETTPLSSISVENISSSLDSATTHGTPELKPDITEFVVTLQKCIDTCISKTVKPVHHEAENCNESYMDEEFRTLARVLVKYIKTYSETSPAKQKTVVGDTAKNTDGISGSESCIQRSEVNKDSDEHLQLQFMETDKRSQCQDVGMPDTSEVCLIKPLHITSSKCVLANPVKKIDVSLQSVVEPLKRSDVSLKSVIDPLERSDVSLDFKVKPLIRSDASQDLVTNPLERFDVSQHSVIDEVEMPDKDASQYVVINPVETTDASLCKLSKSQIKTNEILENYDERTISENDGKSNATRFVHFNTEPVQCLQQTAFKDIHYERSIAEMFNASSVGQGTEALQNRTSLTENNAVHDSDKVSAEPGTETPVQPCEINELQTCEGSLQERFNKESSSFEASTMGKNKEVIGASDIWDHQSVLQESTHSIKTTQNSNETVKVVDSIKTTQNSNETVKVGVQLPNVEVVQSYITPVPDHSKLYNCEFCCQKFINETFLLKHLSVHDKAIAPTTKCVCKVCGREFANEDFLSKHMSVHSEILARKKIDCEICGKVFSTRAGFKSHQRKHMGHTYSCDICSKKFNHPSTLWKHKEYQHSETSNRLQGYGKNFQYSDISSENKMVLTYERSKQSNGDHMGTKRSENFVFPENSSESGSRKNEILETNQASYLPVGDLDGMRSEESRKCGKLDKNLTEVEKAVDKRLSVVENEEGIDMAYEEAAGDLTDLKMTCEEVESNVPKLEHSIQSDVSPNNILHGCNVCGKLFSISGLLLHKQIHTNDVDVIPTLEQSVDSVNKQTMSNGDVAPNKMLYGCNICGKFFSSSELLLHKRYHGVDEGKCDICGKTFKSKKLMVNHRYRLHFEKLQSCNVCGKVYKNRSQVMRHMKEFHFNNNTNDEKLNSSHTSIISDQKPDDFCLISEKIKSETLGSFQCNICDEVFKDKIHHKRHKIVHVGQKMFTCGICGVLFSKRSIFVKHKKKHVEYGLNSKSLTMDCANSDNVSSNLTDRIETDSLANNNLTYNTESGILSNIKFTGTDRLSDNNMTSPVETGSLSNNNLTNKLSDNNTTSPVETGSLSNNNLTNKTEIDNFSNNSLKNKTKPDKVSNFECNVCNKVSDTKQTYIQHVEIHSEKPKVHPCDMCGKEFKLLKHLQAHKKRHFSNYKCDVCGKVTTDKWSYIKHLEIHSENTEVHTCDICGKEYKLLRYLRKHKRIHRKDNPHICDVCGKKFASSDLLKIHQRVHTKEKPYQCDICGKQFSQVAHLTRHRRAVHTGERPYKCEVCGRGFTVKDLMTDHHKVHKTEFPFRCEICGNRFKLETALNSHKKCHKDKVEKEHGSMLYICDICGKKLSSSSTLYVHMKVHTRPYKCDVCGEGFAQRISLESHMVSHTGYRSHKCDICGKGFKTRNSLSIHKTASHSGISINCDVCNLSFTSSTYLARHQRNHKIIGRPHNCDLCGKQFRHKRNLNEHLKIHAKKSNRLT